MSFKRTSFVVLGIALAALTAAQPDWNWTPTSASGSVLGQVTLNGEPGTAAMWIGAFDPDGNCAGAAALIENGGLAYFNLPVYGDDATTAAVDEGITGAEAFTLRLWGAGFEVPYMEAGAEVAFEGWTNANGAPMPGFADAAVVYAFEAEVSVALECPVGPICVGEGPMELVGMPTGGVFEGAGVSGQTFNPAAAGVGLHDLTYTVGTISVGCTVEVVEAPDATPVPVEPLCADAPPVPLEAATPGGIWSGPGVFGDLFDPGAVAPGTVWVSVLAQIGSCTATADLPITVYPVPLAPWLTENPDGSLTAAGLGTNAPTWLADGLPLPEADGLTTLPAPNPSTTYQIVATNAYGCSTASSPLTPTTIPAPAPRPALQGRCIQDPAARWYDPAGRLLHTGPCLPEAIPGPVILHAAGLRLLLAL